MRDSQLSEKNKHKNTSYLLYTILLLVTKCHYVLTDGRNQTEVVVTREIDEDLL
jgi:hypothetical protein